MYKNGDAALDRIIELANKCPKEWQEKCFEILLSGYVQLEIAADHGQQGSQGQSRKKDDEHGGQGATGETSIPAAVLPRFKNAAKRLEVPVERLEALFDFGTDPFTLQPASLTADNKADRTRELALLAAARSYLVGGSWSADWQEVKSLCVDYNCYDAANHTAYLKRAKKLFKNVEANRPIDLSSDGVTQAEQLLKTLATSKAQ